MKPIRPRDFQEFYKQVEDLGPAISCLRKARNIRPINDIETYQALRTFNIMCEHADLMYGFLMGHITGMALCDLDLYTVINPDLHPDISFHSGEAEK